MDSKSTYLLWFFALVAVTVVLLGYRTFFVERNFIIQNTTSCDPQTEVCFMWCGDGKCEEDYYKKIIKNAKYIPVCNPVVEECEPLACGPEEEDCKIISCTSNNVKEGEVCTNPSDFLIEVDTGYEDSATTTGTI